MGRNLLNSKVEKYFELALHEAKKAFKKEEVPIGALIVRNEQIIAAAYNQTEKRNTFLAHAELLCIEKATKTLGTKYLAKCSLYVTLEPCLMCQFAARLCRIDSIYYLSGSKKFGSLGKAYHSIDIAPLQSAFANDALSLLQQFFRKKR